MTPEIRSTLIEKIKLTPSLTRAAVAGLTAAQLQTPFREGAWTVSQIIHHLADSHMQAVIRSKKILTEDHPTLQPYEQDTWALLGDASQPKVDDSLHILDGLHNRWYSFWKNLPESAWTRTAYHPENGEMSLEDILRTYANHGENHVKQITDLRTKNGW
ncbi:MAG: YfiT family bacillithiol transferase [Candidatus Kapaibacterium sp.]|jgi:hypothetical protein